MSYILDALQKSDTERQSQLAPETYRLSRPPETGVHPAKQLLLLICLLVLIAAGLSVLWWLWSPETISLRPQQRISTPISSPDGLANNGTQTPDVAANKPADTPKSSKADNSQAAVQPVMGNTVQAMSASEKSSSQQSIEKTSPPATGTEIKAKIAAQQATNRPRTVQSRQAEVSAPAPKATPPSPKPAQTKIMTTGELPAAVRSALPSMAFSFHVYASDPARRTIIINGRRLREGQSIDRETRLQRITSDGVIIKFRNYRIALPVINQW